MFCELLARFVKRKRRAVFVELCGFHWRSNPKLLAASSVEAEACFVARALRWASGAPHVPARRTRRMSWRDPPSEAAVSRRAARMEAARFREARLAPWDFASPGVFFEVLTDSYCMAAQWQRSG